MARIQQQVGKHGQRQAASYLSGLGFELVEQIGTPVTTLTVELPGHLRYRKDIFRVIYGEKVSGDHRAVLPDGTSVLIETKTVTDGNLTFGHMREHQPDRLSRHAAIGRAVSLLVWVHHSGIYVMQWKEDGIEGFVFRKSITPARAQELHNECMEFLKLRLQSGYCTWVQDATPDGDLWVSACGESWVFLEGGPEENNVKFCHGCGREVMTVVGIEKDEEEDD